MKKISFFGVMLFSFQLVSAQNIDVNILKNLNVHRNKNLDPAFVFITNANNYVNFGMAGSLTISGLIKKDKVLTQNGLFLFSSQLSTFVLTQGLKKTIKRNRPYDKYLFLDPYLKETGYSMPSGHTSAAFTNAMTISFLFPKWYVVVPAFTYASLVGYSRIHLGVHYPTDVIAGAAVGIGSFYATKWVWKKLFLKKMVHKKR